MFLVIQCSVFRSVFVFFFTIFDILIQISYTLFTFLDLNRSHISNPRIEIENSTVTMLHKSGHFDFTLCVRFLSAIQTNMTKNDHKKDFRMTK